MTVIPAVTLDGVFFLIICGCCFEIKGAVNTVNTGGLPPLRVITHQTHNLTSPTRTQEQIVTCNLITLSTNNGTYLN